MTPVLPSFQAKYPKWEDSWSSRELEHKKAPEEHGRPTSPIGRMNQKGVSAAEDGELLQSPGLSSLTNLSTLQRFHCVRRSCEATRSCPPIREWPCYWLSDTLRIWKPNSHMNFWYTRDQVEFNNKATSSSNDAPSTSCETASKRNFGMLTNAIPSSTRNPMGSACVRTWADGTTQFQSHMPAKVPAPTSRFSKYTSTELATLNQLLRIFTLCKWWTAVKTSLPIILESIGLGSQMEIDALLDSTHLEKSPTIRWSLTEDWSSRIKMINPSSRIPAYGICSSSSR